jgi:MFS family permease
MADATTAPPGMMNPAAASDRIPAKRLLCFLIMVFGMFMSILDIQIVSASLNEIQAGLSASQSEVSWVQTSYLIAEVIAIPLSGFLSRAFGTRLLFAISASGFTIASFFCGFSEFPRTNNPMIHILTGRTKQRTRRTNQCLPLPLSICARPLMLPAISARGVRTTTG